MKPLNIVFAGTPAFTLPCLNAILSSPHHVQAVYTQPDRPAGRGRHLQASAVKAWALEHQVPVYQPLNFKDAHDRNQLRALSPDVMVVIAYGLILPQAVLDLPRYGCINVHASLLPDYRGAAPIQSALLHGEKETGITIMQMDAGMDTGPMIVQQRCAIQPHDTSATLHDHLAHLAVPALMQALDDLACGRLRTQAQDHARATYAPKINKTDAAIDWHQSAAQIDQAIRAYQPWPVAYTHLDDLTIRIHQAHIDHTEHTAPPGTILNVNENGLLVSTGRGVLCIDTLQYPGGRILTIAQALQTPQSPLIAQRRFQ